MRKGSVIDVLQESKYGIESCGLVVSATGSYKGWRISQVLSYLHRLSNVTSEKNHCINYSVIIERNSAEGIDRDLS